MQELKKFLEKNNFSKRLNKLNKKLKDKKIIIYGAGKFFRAIVENYDLSNLGTTGASKEGIIVASKDVDNRLVKNKDIVKLS